MWVETTEGRKLIQEISKSIISDIAPEELDLFDELVEEYFQDPTPPNLSQPSKDDPLGFGLSETLVAVVPAATAMVNAVLSHLLTETINASKEESAEAVKKKVKRLFSSSEKGDGDSQPLSKEQLEQVKKTARKQAIQFGLSPEKAEKLANALIGKLALI